MSAIRSAEHVWNIPFSPPVHTCSSGDPLDPPKRAAEVGDEEEGGRERLGLRPDLVGAGREVRERDEEELVLEAEADLFSPFLLQENSGSRPCITYNEKLTLLNIHTNILI